MTGVLSQRLLIGWIAAAVLTFLVSLYFMGNSEQSTETVGASTFSRSAIGYAGIADVLQKLDMPVLKSRSNSLGKVTPGGVLVIAEPLPGAKNEDIMRTLLKADTILLILPKWVGRPSESKPGWISEASRSTKSPRAGRCVWSRRKPISPTSVRRIGRRMRSTSRRI